MNECGGEDRVTSTADDSGMGMAHGSEGEHQVKECGEDMVISTADDFGMGTARGKEGVSVKNVVAATLEMACEHCKESALGGRTEMLPLGWDQAHHGKWSGGFGHTTSQIPRHLAYPKDRDQRILPQALYWGVERLLAGSV